MKRGRDVGACQAKRCSESGQRTGDAAGAGGGGQCQVGTTGIAAVGAVAGWASVGVATA